MPVVAQTHGMKLGTRITSALSHGTTLSVSAGLAMAMTASMMTRTGKQLSTVEQILYTLIDHKSVTGGGLVWKNTGI